MDKVTRSQLEAAYVHAEKLQTNFTQAGLCQVLRLLGDALDPPRLPSYSEQRKRIEAMVMALAVREEIHVSDLVTNACHVLQKIDERVINEPAARK